jgi:hypothetical protein
MIGVFSSFNKGFKSQINSSNCFTLIKGYLTHLFHQVTAFVLYGISRNTISNFIPESFNFLTSFNESHILKIHFTQSFVSTVYIPFQSF